MAQSFRERKAFYPKNLSGFKKKDILKKLPLGREGVEMRNIPPLQGEDHAHLGVGTKTRSDSSAL